MMGDLLRLLFSNIGLMPFFITYADPENMVYDKLALNRGWDTMIRPATAFRFRDRIFGTGQSLDQLFEVLGKWKDGTPQYL